MEENEFNYINVIPFIDIMLVLLIIVLTTSTFIAQGAVRIKLPQVTQNEVETIQTLCIEIDRQGLIYVNSQLTDLERLCDGINNVSRETPVLIRADRRNRVRLLFWSAFCFVALALNSVFVFVDLIVVPETDLAVARSLIALVGLGGLLFGLIWDTR